LIYVDTSLLLPVYVPEVNSELANSVVKGAEDLLVRDLTVAEFLVGLALSDGEHRAACGDAWRR